MFMISGILALSIISSILNNRESTVLHFTTVGARYLDRPRDKKKGPDNERSRQQKGDKERLWRKNSR